MIPVQFDDRQARIGALTLPLERIRLRLLWRADESNREAPGGHAYVLDAGDGAIDIVGLEHGVIDQRGMLALLKLIDRQLDADEDRTSTIWRPPQDNPTVYCDLGGLAELLRGRRLRVLDAATGRPPTTWRLPPEPFLRTPVATWARHLLGVDWPAHWEAPALCGPFLADRRGEYLVFSGARYGTIYPETGQARIAAVFVSKDAGRSWSELPWRLYTLQDLRDEVHLVGDPARWPVRSGTTWNPAGRWCWPPEELLSITAQVGPWIEWVDDWIPEGLGNVWQALWSEKGWAIKKRPRMETWLRYWFRSTH